ncbi:hypothetical protein HWV62_42052, partial [Athelia sp. TMB]
MERKGLRLVFKQSAQLARRVYLKDVVISCAQHTEEVRHPSSPIGHPNRLFPTSPTCISSPARPKRCRPSPPLRAPRPCPSSPSPPSTEPRTASPARIHALAGPTKDFGTSNIKVGALISQANPAIVGMLTETVEAHPMSAAADALFTQIINDHAWCDWFLAANAGVFFVLDLAPLIDKIAPKKLKLSPRLMFVVKTMLKSWIFL